MFEYQLDLKRQKGITPNITEMMNLYGINTVHSILSMDQHTVSNYFHIGHIQDIEYGRLYIESDDTLLYH